ncbi:Spag1 [Scenedesmus sp. PABB004]|nr:Spag1 [Scenedesmus sp. PABB004]
MPAAEDDRVSFKYVFIPADSGEDIEERTFEGPKSDEVLGFINHLKKHFKRAAGHRSDAQQRAVEQAFKAQMGDKAAGVDEGLLRMLSSQQMVEPIALLANAPATGFVGVYLYCDDQATLKALPPNPRATAIAAAAGQHLQVSGDVFVGRYMDNEEDFERLDFTLPAGGAAAAPAAAPRAPAAPARGAAGSAAGAEKAKGNAALRRGDLQAALEHFTASVRLDPAATAARNNRSLVYLKLSMFAEAAADAGAVLAAEPGNVKALLRRAAAREGLGDAAAAAADLRAALAAEPRNADATARLAALEAAAAAAQERQAGQPEEQQQAGQPEKQEQ